MTTRFLKSVDDPFCELFCSCSWIHVLVEFWESQILLRRLSLTLYTSDGNIFSGLQNETKVFTACNTLELSFNSTRLLARSWWFWIQHLPSLASFGSFLEGVFEQETLYIGFIERQTHFGMPSRCGRDSNSNATFRHVHLLFMFK